MLGGNTSKLVKDRSLQPVFIRVDAFPTEDDGIEIYTTKYHGVMETSKGWWVIHPNDLYMLGFPNVNTLAELKKHTRPRWVANDNTSKLAKTTIKIALGSFYARKRSQLAIVRQQAATALAGMEVVKALRKEDMDKLELTGHLVCVGVRQWTPGAQSI